MPGAGPRGQIVRVRGSELGIPADALGPTGDVFLDPRAGLYSTEINVGVSDPRLGAGTVNLPLLVRGQHGIPGLMRGRRPKREQVERAIEATLAGMRRGAPAPASYDTPAEADAAAARHHAAAEAIHVPALQRAGLLPSEPALNTLHHRRGGSR